MRLLHEGVTALAEQRPDATAMVWRGQRTPYGALETASNRLAQLLVDAGCGQGDRVGIFMPKLPEAVVGMLGAMKADAAYVPLDPTDSPARLIRTLEAADCRWILGAAPVAPTLEAALAAATLEREPLIGWLDDPVDDANAADRPLNAIFRRSDLVAFPAHAPPTSNGSDSVAHILFTSGSSGTPKGVTVTHAAVGHFVSWARKCFGITYDDRISQHSPLRFDASTFDIFGALWSGAELHLVPPELNLMPHRLADFIRNARLTQWFSAPSALNLMAKFDAIRMNDFPELKRVLFAGEVLPTPTLAHWMKRLPHASFTNLYGTTETTISSSYFTVPTCPSDERAPIPLGTACDGEELLVLDEHLEPVARGQVGDLYIRGVGVSPGYWRDAEKTRHAFLPDPAGLRDRIYKTGDRARCDERGLLYFCGRAEAQLKNRGYRIEFGEIEAALNTLPELEEAAVVALESDAYEGPLICCAYAFVHGVSTSSNELRERLAHFLPRYMLPARWLRYDALPRNASSKIDRLRLRDAFATGERRDDRSARIAIRPEHPPPRPAIAT